jgi:steroid delta-isomerase-like uncharacterized protein
MNHRERLEALWGIMDRGEFQLMPAYFTDEYRRHSEEGVLSRDGFAAALGELHAGFPDIHSVIHDVLSQGNRMAYRWTATGTHLAPYMGVPPTRRQITAAGITISLFAPDGRVAEEWASWNRASVLHSLGIIPLS